LANDVKRTPSPRTRPPITAASLADFFLQNIVTKGEKSMEKDKDIAVRHPVIKFLKYCYNNMKKSK